MSKKSTGQREARWAEAKRKRRLNAETLRMAKELGLNPRSLTKNIPNKAEPWKAPVHVWIREMYEKRGLQANSSATRTTEGRQEPASGRPAGRATLDGGGTPRTPEGRAVHLGLITGEPYDDREALGEDPFSFSESGDWFDPGEPDEREIAAQDESLLQRREHFRVAADRVAAALSSLSFVRKVVLFGSVAAPPVKEVPRFREFRRAGIAVLWTRAEPLQSTVRVGACDPGADKARLAEGHRLCREAEGALQALPGQDRQTARGHGGQKEAERDEVDDVIAVFEGGRHVLATIRVLP